MKLIVGLGNPGIDYVGTRHNVGWELIDRLAIRFGWVAKPADFDRVAKKKFAGLVLDGNFGGEKVMLLKPTTFMNCSGDSVAAAAGFFQLSTDDTLIALDDLALPAGKIRLRANGSAGGHNGLKDIERTLATNEYPRLRIGIDPKPPHVTQSDYVLGKISPEQRSKIEPAIDRAIDASVMWMEKGIEAAMTRYNGES